MTGEQLGASASLAGSARTRVSDEQIHSSACGSAIEINYDDESQPFVIPFSAEWAFGSRAGGRALNLSVDGKGVLAYSSTHAVVLHDYKSHAQRLLLGHKNTVTAMATDSSGSWLASADAGKLESSSVIVWNLSNASLARVLPGEPPPRGYRVVAMSPDGTLVAAGAGRLLQLWSWWDGACAALELPEHLGEVNAVTFGHDAPAGPARLMVTCDRNVAFITWAAEGEAGAGAGGLQAQPGQLVTRVPGRLLDSAYLRDTDNAISVSDKGYVVLWSDPPLYAPNTKVSRRVYCIDKDGLTALAEVDGMVVVGTSRGHIRFYDQDMCLLHWYQQVKEDAVTGLSFMRHGVDAEPRGVQERLDLSRLISGPSPRLLDAEEPFRARDLIVSEWRDAQRKPVRPAKQREKDNESMMNKRTNERMYGRMNE
ncbi:Cilia- and flagella-associated protein 251 [Frankliniella fusca]|uniref:Cilia- and flagella-associated protein 251 n=1 Tax=Frankliniella fusca TaxID=407009 RepID=A0AAE1GZW4_9NEOP|nr:Cilia- and flagella-associated protein 251 [Frankliniella fusca]